MYSIDYEMNKMSLRRTNNIEVLLERLGSLQIINKVSSKMNEQLDKEISIAQALATMNNNRQAVMLKSMVLDLEWFDRDQTKFEDWWREI